LGAGFDSSTRNKENQNTSLKNVGEKCCCDHFFINMQLLQYL